MKTTCDYCNQYLIPLRYAIHYVKDERICWDCLEKMVAEADEKFRAMEAHKEATI